MIKVKSQTLIQYNQISITKLEVINKLGNYYTFVYIVWNVNDNDVKLICKRVHYKDSPHECISNLQEVGAINN
jgi:hypothetical protein